MGGEKIGLGVTTLCWVVISQQPEVDGGIESGLKGILVWLH